MQTDTSIASPTAHRPAATTPLRIALVPASLLLAAALAVLAARADRELFFAINGAPAVLPGPLLAVPTLLGLGLYATLLLAPTLMRAPRLLAAALVAAPLAGALTHLLKAMLKVPRPLAVLDEASVHVVGWALRGMNALPSGHATTAGTLAAILLLAVAPRHGRAAWIGGVVLLTASIAVARVAVGAHWPTDVLVGAAIGLASGAVGVRVVERRPFWQHFAGRAVLALAVLACAVTGIVDTTDVPIEANWLRFTLIAVGLGTVAVWAWQEWRARRRRR